MNQIPWSHLLPTPPLPAWASRHPSCPKFRISAIFCWTKARQLLALFPPHLQDLHTWQGYNKGSIKAISLPRKRRMKISWSFARESCLLSKLQSNALFKRLLIPSQKNCAHWSPCSQSPWALPTSTSEAIFSLLAKRLWKNTEELFCSVLNFFH